MIVLKLCWGRARDQGQFAYFMQGVAFSEVKIRASSPSETLGDDFVHLGSLRLKLVLGA